MLSVMSKALVKSRRQGDMVSGLVPAACSAVFPGIGQLVNGETDKAIGMLVVAGISGASIVGAIPLLGSLAALVYGATWIYGVADGFIQGRKRG